MPDSEFRDFIQRHLKSDFSVVRLKGDGSDRSFYRIVFLGGTAIGLDHRVHPEEAESYFRIGNHLLSCDIPTPRILEYEKGRFFLLEDLGDRDLFQEYRRAGEGRAFELYGPAVDLLARMQLKATPSFDVAWCFDTPYYTGEFAFERESMYFLNGFVRKGLGLTARHRDIEKELRKLAEEIDRIPFRTFMHRDFQSRNLMIKEGGLFAIDFQGARMGPPQYDLASLLYDPYTMLDRQIRKKLIERYVSAAGALLEPVSEFLEGVGLVALHRLMQALGAFAFLGIEKEKTGFKEFIPGAVAHLVEVWQDLGLTGAPCFSDLLRECSEQVKTRFPAENI